MALLAMLLQVMTPILALDSIAVGATVDRDAISICSNHPDAITHPAMYGGTHQQDHDTICTACPFCCAIHFAIPVSIPVPPQPTVESFGVHFVDLTARPRGPPLSRPKARGPPILS